jgi:hypothetical protein
MWATQMELHSATYWGPCSGRSWVPYWVRSWESDFECKMEPRSATCWENDWDQNLVRRSGPHSEKH